MITTKEGYRFVNVDNTTISGNIIPVLEKYGQTPQSIRKEDLAFLYEAIYQRHQTPTGSRISIDDILKKSRVEAVIQCLQLFKELNYTHSPDIGGVTIYYVGPNTTPTTTLRNSSACDTAYTFALAYDGRFPTFYTDGYSIGDKLDIDAFRRMYADIDHFKWGFYPDVPYNNSVGFTAGTGTWSYEDTDRDNPVSRSENFKLQELGKSVGYEAISLAPLISETYIREGSPSRGYYCRSKKTTVTMSDLVLYTKLKNITNLWIEVVYNIYGTDDAGNTYNKTKHRMIPLSYTATTHGWQSAWRLPSIYWNADALDEVRQAAGVPSAHEITSGTEGSNFMSMQMFLGNGMAFKIESSLFTAEVASTGWVY